MKSHDHKYIAGTIGDECGFCGLLKSTIDSVGKSSDQVWDEALSPLILEVDIHKPRNGGSDVVLLQDKINELVRTVNKLQRP